MNARLHIGGDVAAPRDVTFADLSALAEQQVVERSPLLANRELVGVPLTALLALVRPHAGARAIIAESEDGSFRTALAIGAASQCVIVYRIGKAPLPPGLGGPFQLVTHGRVRSGDVKRLGSLYVSDRYLADPLDSELITLPPDDGA